MLYLYRAYKKRRRRREKCKTDKKHRQTSYQYYCRNSTFFIFIKTFFYSVIPYPEWQPYSDQKQQDIHNKTAFSKYSIDKIKRTGNKYYAAENSYYVWKKKSADIFSVNKKFYQYKYYKRKEKQFKMLPGAFVYRSKAGSDNIFPAKLINKVAYAPDNTDNKKTEYIF